MVDKGRWIVSDRLKKTFEYLNSLFTEGIFGTKKVTKSQVFLHLQKATRTWKSIFKIEKIGQGADQ